MKKTNKEREIDLKSWLFKFRKKWHYFAISLLLIMAAAFLYVKTSTPLYQVKATLMIGDKATGSKQAQELLTLINGKQENWIRVDDEIGLLKSNSFIKQTLDRLDFEVSYYNIEDSWVNKLGDLVVKEQYETAPYKVVIDSSSRQVVGQPVYIEFVEGNKYKITMDATDAAVYDFKESRTTDKLSQVKIEKELAFGEKYNDGNLSFTVVKSDTSAHDAALPPGKNYFIINNPEALVANYQAQLQAYPINKDSKVLELVTQTPVPGKDIKFLDAISEVYIEHDLKMKNENGLKTLKFIEGQLATISDSLKKSEAALSSYRSSRNLMNVGFQSNTSFETLSALESERAKIILNKRYYSDLLSTVKTNSDLSRVIAPSSASAENPVLNNLIMQLAELGRQKAGYSVTATSDNPIIKVLDEKISNTRQALIENIKNTVRSSDLSLNEVQGRIAQIKGTLSSMPDQERQLSNLEGKSAFNDKNYAFLMEKRTEAAIALATNTTDKQVIDKARLASTTPVNSKASGIFALSFLVALIIPAGLIVVSDKANDTIKGKEDLKAITDIPFLGVIAHNPDKKDGLVMLHQSRSAIAESFRSVRINLQYLASNTGTKVIGLTSSISGEGKTFCSVNLSLELASSGKKVVLIETDMRKPTFGNYFNLNNEVGLSTYITDDITLNDAIQQSEHPNLDIISSGPIPTNAIELLELPRMHQLIELLKEQYDYVILDTPPIGFVSEYFIMMRYTDATIYVVRHKYTQKNLLEPINDLYDQGKLQNMYMIINDVNYDKTYEYGYKAKAKGYYV
ncbi:GumC family protein [Pontibacter vulgaris]|uniref:GumC family protein n=1 Tax=Pontibacter vulgaris TaxID=2905679 RepID=UPI001FA7BC19|nr:tyrosine-protein kinase family protein [Pontibacter vulgaris]